MFYREARPRLAVAFKHMCARLLAVTITNAGDNQLIKSKGFVWFIVLGISVHDRLALLLGPVVPHPGGTMCREKLLASWLGGKRAGEEGLEGHAPKDLKTLHQAPPLVGSITFQQHRAGD